MNKEEESSSNAKELRDQKRQSNNLHRFILIVKDRNAFLKNDAILQYINQLAIERLPGNSEEYTVYIKLNKGVVKRLSWWETSFPYIVKKAKPWVLSIPERKKNFILLFQDKPNFEILDLEVQREHKKRPQQVLEATPSQRQRQQLCFENLTTHSFLSNKSTIDNSLAESSEQISWKQFMKEIKENARRLKWKTFRDLTDHLYEMEDWDKITFLLENTKIVKTFCELFFSEDNNGNKEKMEHDSSIERPSEKKIKTEKSRSAILEKTKSKTLNMEFCLRKLANMADFNGLLIQLGDSAPRIMPELYDHLEEIISNLNVRKTAKDELLFRENQLNALIREVNNWARLKKKEIKKISFQRPTQQGS